MANKIIIEESLFENQRLIINESFKIFGKE
jgi:hypothetical protein